MKTITCAEWVAALRSGKYKQAKKKLHNSRTGGFCCLGVACDLAGIDLKTVATSFETLSDEFPDIADMLALGSNEENKLIRANDAGKRFSTIAKMIEAHGN